MKKVKYTGESVWNWAGVNGDRSESFYPNAPNDSVFEVSDDDYHFLIEKTKNKYFEPVE